MLTCLGRSQSPSTVQLITTDPLATISTRASADTVYGVTRLNPLFAETGPPTGDVAASELSDDVFVEDPGGLQPPLPARPQHSPQYSEPVDRLRAPQTAAPARETPFTLPRQPSRGRELRLCGDVEPFTPPAPVWPHDTGQATAQVATVSGGGVRPGPLESTRAYWERVASGDGVGAAPVALQSGALARVLQAAEAPVSMEMAPDSLVTESLLILTSPEYTPAPSLKPNSKQLSTPEPPAIRKAQTLPASSTLPLTNQARQSVWSLNVDRPGVARRAQSSSAWSLTEPRTARSTSSLQRPRSVAELSHSRRPISEVVSSSRAATMARRASSGSGSTTSPSVGRRTPPSRLSQGRPDPQTVLDPMQFVLRLWEKTGMRTNGRRLLMNEPESDPPAAQLISATYPRVAAVHASNHRTSMNGPPIITVGSSGSSSGDSHVYSEIASVDLSNMVVPDTYTWCEVAPSYLNQLLPDSSAGSCAASARGSESSEGGSERRVTFSADTVDNEPRSSRPRRIYETHGLKPTRRPGADADRSGVGYYGSNLITVLRAEDKVDDIKSLTPKPATDIYVGDSVPEEVSVPLLARPRSRRWCLLLLLLFVLAALLAIVMLSSWYLTDGERWFGFI